VLFRSDGFAYEWIVYSTGFLSTDSVHYTYSLRPAVSLKSNVTLKANIEQDGTSEKPFIIED